MQDASEKTGRAFAGLVCRIARKDVSVIKDGLHPTVFAARASVFGRLLAVFAAAYVLFFICPEALGSGSGLVAQISRGDFALKALAVLLLIKFVF
jgi:H+/Cl- antiporter ClcA